VATRYDSSLIYEGFEESLGLVIGGSSVSKNHKDLALILTQLAYVYNAIKEARAKAGIKDVFPFEEGYDYSGITNKMAGIAIEAAQEICEHYNLSEVWLGSFYIAVLTHTLPIPEDAKIEFILPKNMATGLEGLIHYMRRPHVIQQSNSILIEIPTNSSVNQIVTFLNTNKTSLDKYLARLPNDKPPKTEKRAMFIGQVTWFVFQDQPQATWNEVLAELERLWSTKGERLPKLPDDIQKLKILYKRYLDSLNIISNSKS